MTERPRLLLDLATKASLLEQFALCRGDKRLATLHIPLRKGKLALVATAADKADLDAF